MDKKKTQQKPVEEKKTPLIKKEEPKKVFPKRKVAWAGGVNVRQEPSLDATIIVVRPFGEVFEVLEEKEVNSVIWVKSDKGWSMKEYTEEVK